MTEVSPGLPGAVVARANRSRIFPAPGLALLAVSGGADSTALLDLFCGAGVGEELGVSIAVAHVDHGIQLESAAVAEAVARLAAQYGVPYYEHRLELGHDASETKARAARYLALRDIQGEIGARYLVTAHHADDQVETILYRFLRGSGMAGLAGMRAKGPGGLVRPLLTFTGAELAAWVVTRGLGPHEDPANDDLRHDRSWLRHRVLPLLRERFGEAGERRILNVGRHAAADRQAWATLLRTWSELGFRRERVAVEVARAPLAGYDKALCQAILRALARELGVVIGSRRAEEVRAFVVAGTSGKTLPIGSGWQVQIVFDRVRIARDSADSVPGPIRYGVEESGSARWGGWQFDWKPEPAGKPERMSLITWVVPGAGGIRGLGAGDRVKPLGGIGRRRVRRLLMEARVSFGARAGYPVLEQNGRVVWVPGVCRAAYAVPGPGEPALRIEARDLGRSTTDG